MTYYRRHIDKVLLQWKDAEERKPLLIRGARQVGKSTAVRELGKSFKYFIEVNLEKQPDLQKFFTKNIDVKKTCENLSGTFSIPIVPGKSLLFIDEIQTCQEAIMSLRYFKEDYPELHVIAAGSLLEFALNEIPSFAVGRIRSVYMYPFSFDEFLMAQELDVMLEYKQKANNLNPLPDMAHHNLIDQLRSFYIVGGMPAAVDEWVKNHSYIEVSHIHKDIIDTYQADFSKYKKRISPDMLKMVLRSVALQAGEKFVYAEVGKDLSTYIIKDALYLLTLAGIITPVTHSNANGIPLGAEINDRYVKYLFFDLGLMQTMLDLPAADTLMASDVDFVNKGAASEMFAGLELQKYSDCIQKSEMYYWQNTSRNSLAEVDYVCNKGGRVLPIEVKAGTRGGMQSLWQFMRKHHLHNAIRTSLENFGHFTYTDDADNNAERHVDIIPLYALSNI